MNSPEITAAETRFLSLSKRLFDQSSSRPPLSTRRSLERQYGKAYQDLVLLGVRPQLRKKYRG